MLEEGLNWVKKQGGRKMRVGLGFIMQKRLGL